MFYEGSYESTIKLTVLDDNSDSKTGAAYFEMGFAEVALSKVSEGGLMPPQKLHGSENKGGSYIVIETVRSRREEADWVVEEERKFQAAMEASQELKVTVVQANSIPKEPKSMFGSQPDSETTVQVSLVKGSEVSAKAFTKEVKATQDPKYDEILKPPFSLKTADFAADNVSLRFDVGKNVWWTTSQAYFMEEPPRHGSKAIALSKLKESGKLETIQVGAAAKVSYKVESKGFAAEKQAKEEHDRRVKEHQGQLEEERKKNAAAVEKYDADRKKLKTLREKRESTKFARLEKLKETKERLTVKVIKVESIQSVSSINPVYVSDPYVQLELRGPINTNKKVEKTATKDNDLTPIFEEEFLFELDSAQFAHDPSYETQLHLNVMDVGGPTLMGSVVLPLHTVQESGEKTLNLSGPYATNGLIYLRITRETNDEYNARMQKEREEKEEAEKKRKEQEAARTAELNRLRGIKKWLHVTVEKCQGLINTQWGSMGNYSDPKVRVRLRFASGQVDEKDTIARTDQTDPIFGQSFEFELDESQFMDDAASQSFLECEVLDDGSSDAFMGRYTTPVSNYSTLGQEGRTFSEPLVKMEGTLEGEGTISFKIAVEGEEERTARLSKEAEEKAEADKLKAEQNAKQNAEEEALSAQNRHVTVRVEKGEGLKDVDGGFGFGVSDPFVDIVYRKRDRTTTEFHTERVDDNLNPVFGYEFGLGDMTALDLRDGQLDFIVKDWNATGYHADLGHARIQLGDLEGTESTLHTLELADPESDKVGEWGKILVRTTVETGEQKSEREAAAAAEKQKLLDELKELAAQPMFLKITVDKCEKLLNLETLGISDPYVRLTLKRSDGTTDHFETEYKDSEPNPVYQSKFEFEVDRAQMKAGDSESTLVLEVVDADASTVMGGSGKDLSDPSMGSVIKSLSVIDKLNGPQTDELLREGKGGNFGTISYTIRLQTGEDRKKEEEEKAAKAREKAEKLLELAGQAMFLNVTINKCSNLLNLESMGCVSDPYVKCIFERGGGSKVVDTDHSKGPASSDVYQTDPVLDEMNPVFGDTFPEIVTNMAQLQAPPMPDGRESTLRLQVWDENPEFGYSDKMMAQLVIQGGDIPTNPEELGKLMQFENVALAGPNGEASATQAEGKAPHGTISYALRIENVEKRAERENKEKEAEAARVAKIQELEGQKAWLTVTVQHCKNLQDVESIMSMGTGVSDPYVKVVLRPAGGPNTTVKDSQFHQTEPVLDNLDPEYNVDFEFESNQLQFTSGKDTLELEVWDLNSETFGDKQIGKVYVPLSKLESGLVYTKNLEGASDGTKDGAGSITFVALKETDQEHEVRRAKEQSAEEEELKQLAAQQMYLQITVEKGEDMPNVETLGYVADPYIKLWTIQKDQRSAKPSEVRCT